MRIMKAIVTIGRNGTVNISLENRDPAEPSTVRYWTWNRVNNRISVDFPVVESRSGRVYPKYPIRDSRGKDVTLEFASAIIQFIGMRYGLKPKISPLKSERPSCRSCRFCRFLKTYDTVLGDAESEVPSLSTIDMKESGDYIAQIACAITGKDPLESGGKLRNKDYTSGLRIRSKQYYSWRSEREVAEFCPYFRDRHDQSALRYIFEPIGNGKFICQVPGYKVIIG